MNQLEIPVPPTPVSEIGSWDEQKQLAAYAQTMGVEAAQRQRELYEQEHCCTCKDSEGASNEGKPLRFHKPHCKLRPLQSRRR